jgi:hypothetical protein
MIDLHAICPECGELYGKHRLVHPKRFITPRPIVLCPLCGGKMHRKGLSDTTEFECAWRQWARDTGHLSPEWRPESPHSGDVPRVTPDLLLAFAEWRAAHPQLEAGEVPASRILRQRARDEAAARLRAKQEGGQGDGQDSQRPRARNR